MIVILTQCYPPRLGGIENLIENLSIELSKHYEVTILADQHNENLEKMYDQKRNNNIVMKRIGGIKFLRKRKKISELKKILLSRKITCIIGDSWKSFEFSINLINSFNVPSICLAHGNEVIIKSPKHALRFIPIMNKVSYIVCNSSFTLGMVKKAGVTNKNITFIHPGAENYSDHNKKTIINIQGDPILLTLARLEKRKGHEYILSVVAKLKIDYPNIQYVIAGSGIELENLIDQTKSLKIEKNVIFVGNVDNNQKNYLFEKTTLMVMPTIDESAKSSIEGFGIAYIEASFYGIPSIASNIGGTNEAVLHNKTGLIISNIDELYNSLKELLCNQNKLKKLGENAKMRAESDFIWSKIVKKYLYIINKIGIKN
jgi:phosphatidylinositol alpha-1,6-mannosyltransferase